MPRRLLCLLENEKTGHAGRAVLEWAAFLATHCGFDVCVFLWEDASSIEVPESLKNAQGFCLEDFPPLLQMSTLDLVNVAGEIRKRFPADLVLVPASISASPLHLLGAALSGEDSGRFWFGVFECILLPESRFACRRTLNGRTLEAVAAYPLTLAVAHHLGIEPCAVRTRLSLQKLPLSGFNLDADMLQMRSAVFPEPVSILHSTEVRTVQLDEALASLVPKDAEV